MFKHFHYHRPHYFVQHLSKQIEELYINVAIMDFAVSAMMIFVPIYLYTEKFALWEIMGFFAIVYGVYFCIIPLGAKFVGRYGYEKGILVSSLAYAAHFVALFSIPSWPHAFWVAAVLFAIQKTFYWPAYHADFGNFSFKNDRGSEVGGVVALDQIIFIIGPLIGGTIIKFFGFPVLFGVAVLLILLSNVPIFMTTEKVKKVNVGFAEQFTFFADKKRRNQLWAYLGFGEEVIAMFIWPIFIYIAVSDFVEIGSIIAVATLVTSLIALVVGKLFDRGKRNQIIISSTILYIITWPLRLLTRSGGSIFVLDSMQRIFKNTLYVPILADMYSHAGKNKFLLQSGVFYEQALSLGKVIALLVVMAATLFVDGFIAAFVVGGLMSLLYLVILKTDVRTDPRAVAGRR